MECDVLIQGGEVVDPSQGLRGVRDVLVTGDRISGMVEHAASVTARVVSTTSATASGSFGMVRFNSGPRFIAATVAAAKARIVVTARSRPRRRRGISFSRCTHRARASPASASSPIRPRRTDSRAVSEATIRTLTSVKPRTMGRLTQLEGSKKRNRPPGIRRASGRRRWARCHPRRWGV